MTAETAAKKTAAAPAAPADKAKPGRKPGTKAEPKKLVPLDMSQIVVTKVQDPETMRDHRRSRGERDQDQVAIDSLVRESHKRWIEAGRPEEWGKCIAASYTLRVPKMAQDTVETRIRRAGTYFDVSIRFGVPKDLEGGFVQILFFAKDRPVKDAKSAEEGDTSNGTDSDKADA